jgi:hypothetical protein
MGKALINDTRKKIANNLQSGIKPRKHVSRSASLISSRELVQRKTKNLPKDDLCITAINSQYGKPRKLWLSATCLNQLQSIDIKVNEYNRLPLNEYLGGMDDSILDDVLNYLPHEYLSVISPDGSKTKRDLLGCPNDYLYAVYAAGHKNEIEVNSEWWPCPMIYEKDLAWFKDIVMKLRDAVMAEREDVKKQLQDYKEHPGKIIGEEKARAKLITETEKNPAKPSKPLTTSMIPIVRYLVIPSEPSATDKIRFLMKKESIENKKIKTVRDYIPI